MIRSTLAFRVANACAAVMLLGGCAGSRELAHTVPGAPALVAAHADSSWMNAAAKKGALLYGSSFSDNAVDVYTYPKGVLAGTLTGFDEPEGECVDAAGTVWIVNTGTSQLIAYAHGGTSPIATLDDPNQFPSSCSVSPSGDLAVANIAGTDGSPGSVSVYSKARGTPVTYSDPAFAEMYFLGYDGAGNLFVDGVGASRGFQYAELPKAARKLKNLTLQAKIAFPGDVQYDGKHVAVGDQGSATVYQTLGAKVVGTTTLQDAGDVATFFITGGRIVCPYACAGDVAIYAYPRGGPPLKILTLTGGAPGVVVVSRP